jgi:hypothetical protein
MGLTGRPALGQQDRANEASDGDTDCMSPFPTRGGEDYALALPLACERPDRKETRWNVSLI